MGVRIDGGSIDFRQDWEDVYFMWGKVKGVQESGCVLFRPDRFVALRSVDRGHEMERLRKAMQSVLGLKKRS